VRSIVPGQDRFEAVLSGLAALEVRPEFTVQEAPAPHRLAPSTVAVTAEMSDPDSDLVSGRFVLLHDPDGVDEWEGSFRAVAFVRAEWDEGLLEEDLLHDVAWSWVQEALEFRGCVSTHLGGTVTRTAGRSFGSMADRPSDGFLEIRASWTPVEDADGNLVNDIVDHAGAWLDLMAQAAGLPPIPDGVALMGSRRNRVGG
jgi:hypothetical protein